MLLDEVLPTWHKQETHHRRTSATAPDLLRATQELTWDEVAAFRALMRLRAGGRRPGDGTILAGMTRVGFVELARGPREVVYGLIGRPWTRRGDRLRLDGPDPKGSFVDFDRPGYAKTAFNFHAGDGGLSTQTRVYLTDAGARRAFSVYWLLVRPFSGWIRREWLAGITHRTDRG